MSEVYHLTTAELRAMQPKLNAGDRVILSGTIYTARDAAHKRLFALLDEGKELPLFSPSDDRLRPRGRGRH